MCHFLREVLFVSMHLRVACTKAVAMELMDVSGLYDLNEQSRRVPLSFGLCLES